MMKVLLTSEQLAHLAGVPVTTLYGWRQEGLVQQEGDGRFDLVAFIRESKRNQLGVAKDLLLALVNDDWS
jgi:hypothetical protein